MGSNWTKVFDHKNRCVGHIRETRAGKWQVKSAVRTKSFDDWFEAHTWLIVNRRGVKWQVKTSLSHQYWTGSDWSLERLEGKVFARKGDAEVVASTFENPSLWDKVVVVPFKENNWRDANDGMPSCIRIRK
jgi:hypothetical protein